MLGSFLQETRKKNLMKQIFCCWFPNYLKRNGSCCYSYWNIEIQRPHFKRFPYLFHRNVWLWLHKWLISTKLLAFWASYWCKISSIHLIWSKYNYSLFFRTLWLNKIKDLPEDVFSKLSTLKMLYVHLRCYCLKLCPNQTNGDTVCLVSSSPTNIAISSTRLTFIQIFRNKTKITNRLFCCRELDENEIHNLPPELFSKLSELETL